MKSPLNLSISSLKNDGVGTPQLLRRSLASSLTCAASFVTAAYRMDASFLRTRALHPGFLLSHHC